jgi:hypothetical protein
LINYKSNRTKLVPPTYTTVSQIKNTECPELRI